MVSIVTPVFNGSKYLEDLIKSVLDQDYPFIEHIIIDDGSDDNGLTVSILKKYGHLRWWTRPNKGAYPTINEGLSAAIGELVTVICADDLYAGRTAISSAVDLWRANPSCDAVYGETIRIDENGLELDRQPPLSGPIWLFRYYAVITHCSLLVKRSVVVDDGNYFNISYPYAADYEWIYRLIKKRYHFKRLRKPIAMFREHPMQRSQDENPVRLEEKMNLRKTCGNLNPFILFVVNKWWRFVKIKNLFFRRGLGVGIYAISDYFSKKNPNNQLN